MSVSVVAVALPSKAQKTSLSIEETSVFEADMTYRTEQLAHQRIQRRVAEDGGPDTSETRRDRIAEEEEKQIQDGLGHGKPAALA